MADLMINMFIAHRATGSLNQFKFKSVLRHFLLKCLIPIILPVRHLGFLVAVDVESSVLPDLALHGRLVTELSW